MTVDHRSARETGAREAPYRFFGTFYEACDCYSICPCWTGDVPDEGECTGVFAWDVRSGSIEGVEVAGRRVVSVSHHTGHRDDARQRVMLFVDHEATAQQCDALVAALTGQLGGPLAELSDLLGEFLGIEHVPIALEREGRLTTLTVGRRIHVDGVTTVGPTGHATMLSDGALSVVLGSPAEVGVSSRFRVGLPAGQMAVNLQGRSTMSGRFAYEHAPATDRRA